MLLQNKEMRHEVLLFLEEADFLVLINSLLDF